MEEDEAGMGMEKDRNSSHMLNNVVRKASLRKSQRCRGCEEWHADNLGRALHAEGRARQWSC